MDLCVCAVSIDLFFVVCFNSLKSYVQYRSEF